MEQEPDNVNLALNQFGCYGTKWENEVLGYI